MLTTNRGVVSQRWRGGYNSDQGRFNAAAPKSLVSTNSYMWLSCPKTLTAEQLDQKWTCAQRSPHPMHGPLNARHAALIPRERPDSDARRSVLPEHCSGVFKRSAHSAGPCVIVRLCVGAPEVVTVVTRLALIVTDDYLCSSWAGHGHLVWIVGWFADCLVECLLVGVVGWLVSEPVGCMLCWLVG